MKIFLAHKMTGIEENDILKYRKAIFNFWQMTTHRYNENDEVIENYYHDDAPENASRLWHLGKSIQQLSEADIVIFAEFGTKFYGGLGMQIEKKICKLYKIPYVSLSNMDTYYKKLEKSNKRKDR